MVQFNTISQKEFQSCFNQLKTHWNKSVECQGDYFEENYHFNHRSFLSWLILVSIESYAFAQFCVLSKMFPLKSTETDLIIFFLLKLVSSHPDIIPLSFKLLSCAHVFTQIFKLRFLKIEDIFIIKTKIFLVNIKFITITGMVGNL